LYKCNNRRAQSDTHTHMLAQTHRAYAVMRHCAALHTLARLGCSHSCISLSVTFGTADVLQAIRRVCDQYEHSVGGPHPPPVVDAVQRHLREQNSVSPCGPAAVGPLVVLVVPHCTVASVLPVLRDTAALHVLCGAVRCCAACQWTTKLALEPALRPQAARTVASQSGYVVVSRYVAFPSRRRRSA
jgi:hypothetical protein